VFDVALLTGLPATGRRTEFDNEEVSSEMSRMLRERMAGIVAARRRSGRQTQFRH